MQESRTTSSPELLLSLQRRSGRPLHAQLADQVRAAIRAGTLPTGARLPSSRVLAQDLGLSRGVIVDVFAQLVAEGYLESRQGSGTRVAAAAHVPRMLSTNPPTAAGPRYDFRPGVPDVRLFSRAAWEAALRHALRTAPDAALGYSDPRGAPELRTELAAYLARVRGVAADPARLIVTTGFAQGLALLCHVLHRHGVERIAVEDPGHPDQRVLIERAGLAVVPVPVDDGGMALEALVRTGVRAIVVTPAHQFPSGAVLAPERRAALVAWARERDVLIVEDDYDAEYRYDRAPVGAV